MATAKETMNAIQNKTQGAVATKQEKSLKDWIKVMEPQIARALPSVLTPERFTRMVTTALSTTPKLANTTPQSFLGAMMNAAQLGLEPNTPLGQAYLIPYNNNKKGCVETQFQIGYKGLIDLAHRSGEFKMIYAKEVYENDIFTYEFGLEPKLEHKPSTDKDKGKVLYYYAVYTLVNGGFGFEVMSKEEVIAHKNRYSKARTGPWVDNFDEMAKKTVIKKLLKYAPIKTEFVRETMKDQTITNAKPDDTEGVLMEDIAYVDANYDILEEENEKPIMATSDNTSEVTTEQ